jgi:hypothetical protein
VDAAGEFNRILADLGPLGLLLEKQFTPPRPMEDMCLKVAEIEAAAARAMSRLPHVEARDANSNVILDGYVSEINRKEANGRVVCTREKVTLDEPVWVLQDEEGGRLANVPLHHLAARLGELFEAETGRPASRQWRDHYAQEYRDSRFVNFLRAALNLAGRARLKRYGRSRIDDLIRYSKPYRRS